MPSNDGPTPHVLLITPWPPYPFDGGSKRIHTLCRLLKYRFRFSLLTFRPRVTSTESAIADLDRERAYLKDVFQTIHWVDAPSHSTSPKDGPELPDDVKPFFSEAMVATLQSILSRDRVDLVHVEYDLMAPYGMFVGDTPAILTQHDLGGISFFGSYFREMAGWRKFLRINDWRKRMRYERKVNALYDRIVLVTEGDCADAAKVARRNQIRVVRTGVDIEEFREVGTAQEGSLIAFVGHYPHYPNEDAALVLCREIFPRILLKRPDARLSLIGSLPTPAVLTAARSIPGVTVTGTVPDVRPHLEKAAVFAAPVRLGRGIKGKILEAFAAGIPVVATPTAAAGIEAVPGRDLVVAADHDRFADAVVQLLGDERMRRLYGENGRKAAENGYDWRKLAPQLGAVYDELVFNS